MFTLTQQVRTATLLTPYSCAVFADFNASDQLPWPAVKTIVSATPKRFLMSTTASTSLRTLAARHASAIGAALSASVLLSALTGCGIGTQAVSPAVQSSAPTASLSGRTRGGPNPIIGATIKLYTTGNSDGTNGGYGIATLRQEANAVSNPGGYPSGDTDTSGNFQFAGGLCLPRRPVRLSRLRRRQHRRRIRSQRSRGHGQHHRRRFQPAAHRRRLGIHRAHRHHHPQRRQRLRSDRDRQHGRRRDHRPGAHPERHRL